MARPVMPTPTVRGREARKLLESLKDVASPEVERARTEHAKAYLAEMMRPKGFAPKPR